MNEDWPEWECRVLNRLTVVKLTIQLLERRSALSSHERALVAMALAAVDALTLELQDVSAPRSRHPRNRSSAVGLNRFRRRPVRV